MKVFVVGIAAFLLTTPAWALGPDGESESHANHVQAAEQASSSSQGENEGERRICRRVDDNTGTRTAGRRVCLTPTQWREFNRRN